MAEDLEITGTQQFVALAKRLNAQGKQGRGLWNELNAQMRTAAQPMTDTVLRHLDMYLPSGYAPVMRSGLTVRMWSGANPLLSPHATAWERRWTPILRYAVRM